MNGTIDCSKDWRYYTIPWDLTPHPPWDVPSPPDGSPVPWPPAAPMTMYFTTHWPNATRGSISIDPFGGWTAQERDALGNWVMRPAVPGLTS